MVNSGKHPAVARFCTRSGRREQHFAVADRRRGNGSDAAGQRVDGASSVGVYTVTEENHEQIELRINPQRSSRETSVPEGTLRKKVAAIRRVTGANIPAEAA